jgi:hypothetical protein
MLKELFIIAGKDVLILLMAPHPLHVVIHVECPAIVGSKSFEVFCHMFRQYIPQDLVPRGVTNE